MHLQFSDRFGSLRNLISVFDRRRRYHHSIKLDAALVASHRATSAPMSVHWRGLIALNPGLTGHTTIRGAHRPFPRARSPCRLLILLPTPERRFVDRRCTGGHECEHAPASSLALSTKLPQNSTKKAGRRSEPKRRSIVQSASPESADIRLRINRVGRGHN
jgi:hypothetical protein